MVYERTVQNCTMKKARTKKPAARNRLIEEPSLNNLNHVFEVYKESGSDVDYIEDSLKGENKKNLKEDNYTKMDEEKEGKQADLLRSKITRYDHDIPRKKGENEKALVTNEMELSDLGKNIFIGDSAATSHRCVQSGPHKWLSNDWEWEKHQMHPQGKIGCHLQAQGWIHSQRDLGCENCARIEPRSIQFCKSHERWMADEWKMERGTPND